MTISYTGSYNGTNGPATLNYTAAYNVVSSSASQIALNLNYAITNGTKVTTEAISTTITTAGSIVTLDVNGTSIPLGYSSNIVIGLFAGFIVEIENAQSLQVFTGAQFHSTGTSSVTIGTVPITVTNYVPNSYPVAFSYCSGGESLSKFAMSVGTPSGASVPVVTYMNFVGSQIGSNGQSSGVNFTIQVTALTVA
jgi:hypothetical protein